MMAAANYERLEPCGFMRRWINGLLDGSLHGAIRWYAQYHISRCSRCQAALEAIQALRECLRNLALAGGHSVPELSSERRVELNARLDRIESLRSRCEDPPE
jgi:hypothetical protein